MHRKYFTAGLFLGTSFTFLLTNIYIRETNILITKSELPERYRRRE